MWIYRNVLIFCRLIDRNIFMYKDGNNLGKFLSKDKLQLESGSLYCKPKRQDQSRITIKKIISRLGFSTII